MDEFQDEQVKMSKVILRVILPPRFPLREKVLRFDLDLDNRGVVDRILRSVDPQATQADWQVMVLSTKMNQEQWMKDGDRLHKFRLMDKDSLYLYYRFQAIPVSYTAKKVIYLDISMALEALYNQIAKRFSVDGMGERLFIFLQDGKAALDGKKSLVSQGYVLDTTLHLRPAAAQLTEQKQKLTRRQRLTINLGGRQVDRRGTLRIASFYGQGYNAQQALVLDLSAPAKAMLKEAQMVVMAHVRDTKSKWHKRALLLCNQALYVYKTKHDAKPTLAVDVGVGSASPLGEKDAKHGLVISNLPAVSGGQLFIRFDSSKDRTEWLKQIVLVQKQRQVKGDQREAKKGYFGMPLQHVVDADASVKIPKLITLAVEYIEARAMRVEGIYRLSGSRTDIDVYKERFNSGEDVNFSEESDPHAVAGVLKLYLRELPEPLLTYSRYQDFIDCMAVKDHALKLRYMRYLLSTLDETTITILKYLMKHLYRVNELSDINKMALHNLATVFAPNLLKKQGANMFEMVGDTAMINQIVHCMIVDFECLFEGKEVPFDKVNFAPAYRAEFDYEPNGKGEIGLVKGSTVLMIRDTDGGGWMFGESKGRFGKFPASYVRALDDRETKRFYRKLHFVLELARTKKEEMEIEQQVAQLEEENRLIEEDLARLCMHEGDARLEMLALQHSLEKVEDTSMPFTDIPQRILPQFLAVARDTLSKLESVEALNDQTIAQLRSVQGSLKRTDPLWGLLDRVQEGLMVEQFARLNVMESKEVVLSISEDLLLILLKSMCEEKAIDSEAKYAFTASYGVTELPGLPSEYYS